jgi:MFS family permease
MTDSSERPRHSRLTISAMALSNFVTPFMGTGVVVTLPSMGRELAMSGTTVGLFEMAYLGAMAAFVLPAGQLADSGDKRSFFVLGMAVFALSTLGLAVTPNVEVAVLLRVAQGLAAAFVTATNMALLRESVHPNKFGLAIGINIAAVYVGMSAGPFVAGVLTTTAGWRSTYLISSAMAAGVTALALLVVRPRWTRPRGALDRIGTLLSTSALTLLLVGSTRVSNTSVGWFAVVAGLALFVVFVRQQSRVASPLLPVRLLAEHPVLTRALLIQLLTYAGGIGTTFLFTLYLQEARGWTAAETGALLMISPVLMAALAPVAGHLADRGRPQRVALLGVALIFVGTATAWAVGLSPSVPLVVGALVAHGVGFALFSSPNMTIVMTAVPPHHTAMGSALASSMRTLGMVVSMLLITVFLSLSLGDEGFETASATDGVLTTLRWSTSALLVLSVLALMTASRDRAS